MIVCLPACICSSVAGYLAMHDKEGWGWFLFVGLFLAGSVKIKTGKNK